MEVFGLFRYARGLGKIDLILRLDMLIQEMSAKLRSQEASMIPRFTGLGQDLDTCDRKTEEGESVTGKLPAYEYC
jgi:hypothetical protein